MGASDMADPNRRDTGITAEMLDLSDEELFENTRNGSIAAFEELWQRHSVFGLVAANALTDGDGDDVNTQAWARILMDIRAGAHPHTAFRPYLYSCVLQAVTGPHSPSDDIGSRMGEAFSTMPARWQEVLWYLDVERMNPDDVTFLTGLSPEIVASTQKRARMGLSNAWLKTNADHADPESRCRWVREHGRAYLKNTSPQKDVDAVDLHLASCAECRAVIDTGRQMGTQARKLLFISIAGETAATALVRYLKVDGPIVINEDPLPESIVATFAATDARASGVTAPAVAAPQPAKAPVAAAPVAVAAPLVAAAAVAVPAVAVPAAEEVASAAEPSPADISPESEASAAPDSSDLPAEPPVAPTPPAPEAASTTEPDLRSPQTYADQEQKRRRRGALWLAILVLVAMIAAIIAIAVLASRQPDTPPVVTPTTAVPSDSNGTPLGNITTPTAPTETPSATETPEATPTPTDEPTSTPTQAPSTVAPPPRPPATTVPPTPVSTYPVASIRSIDTGPQGTLFPIITGTAEPGDTISVNLNGSIVNVTADARGNWSFSGPYNSIAAGLQSVTAIASLNQAPVTTTFTLPAGPQASVSKQGGVVLSIHGAPNAPVQVLVDGTARPLITLNSSGDYLSEMNITPNGHSILVRYYSSGRVGPSTGPITI
ncbi:MAG: hypothetical protein FWD75_07455 [Propionibacteriaceae bacterium]|nr:hypothetical protein [Propionibacteriaceae bacterium]